MESDPQAARAALPPQGNAILVSKVRLAAILSAVTMILVVLSLAAAVLSPATNDNSLLSEARESFVRLFLLDLEENVPSWYSALLLFGCSVLLLTIGLAHNLRHRPYVRHWLLLASIFVCLSLDESAEIHEMAIKPLRAMLHATGFIYFAWVIPGAIAVAILALSYLGFLRALPGRTRRLFVIAAVVYLGGALIIESVSGMQASLHGKQNLMYQTISSIEEMFEMGGLVIFLYGLFDYIDREIGRVSFEIS